MTQAAPPRRRTPLTWALAASWIAVYVAALVVGGGFRPVGDAWWAFGGPHVDALVRLGALVPDLVRVGEWQRLGTHGFLHLFVLHLLLNVWAWSVVGGLLEMAVGPARTWIVFAVAVLGGGLAHMAFRGGLAVGASGGVFGVVGALGVWAFRAQHPLTPVAGRTAIAFLLLSGLLLLVPGAGHEAHFGGLAAGALAMVVIGPRRSLKRPGRGTWVTALVLLVAFASAGWVQAREAATRPDPAEVRAFLVDLRTMERKARSLSERPDLDPEGKRDALARRLDALLDAPVLRGRPEADALGAYLEAWRPVAEGNVPDPLRFDVELEAARRVWRPHLRRLEVLAGAGG